MVEGNKSNKEIKVLYAIDKNGKIVSIPEIKDEVAHFQPYRRLNKEIDNKIGVIAENDTSTDLSKRVAQLGYINIYPALVFDLEYCGFMVVFPANKTEKQLESLKSLYDVLEEKEGIGFFKKTIVRNKDLYFDEYEIGLEKLKSFVEEELETIKNNYDRFFEGSR